MEDEERIALGMIAHGGSAKSCVYDALEAYTNGDFDGARKLLIQAEEELAKAHEFQSKLIFMEAQGEEVRMTVLYVHALDIIMTAITEKDLAKKMIALLEKNNKDRGNTSEISKY